MKRRSRQIFITAGIIFVGLLLILYPFISNFMYEHRQEQVIFEYEEQTDSMDDERAKAELRKAQTYNQSLSQNKVILTDPFDESALKNDILNDYEDMLNPYGDGLMGYIEIPKISVYLPIYHGTTAKILENGIGHLENTSLPVGGKSTHCVLSGHTGLSDKRLFTDLEMLTIGDLFYVQVLKEHLAYQVDQILVVLPQDTKELGIIPEKDYMTLVTCTPYGVNSHRLLVRGRRVPYVPEEKAQTGEKQVQSQWMRQYAIAVTTGIAVLIGLMILFNIIRKRKNRAA